jgi:hypothetical protein
MRIIGIMAARNEDWVLGMSARAALLWLDELIILDHASTDRTCDIAAEVSREHPDRVSILLESDPVWEEMRHRQRMLVEARERGATHICYIDADEILTGDLLGGMKFEGTLAPLTMPIRQLFRRLPPNSLLQIPWLQLRGSIGQVHVAGPWADGQVASFGFADDLRLHWSSEKRGGYDFHHRAPMGKPLIPWAPLGTGAPFAPQPRTSGLMHLQMVSGRRLRAKQSLYKMTEVIRWPGREPVRVVNERYNLAVYGEKVRTNGCWLRMSDTLAEAPSDRWWGPYSHLMRYFKPHTIPWQEAECLRLLAEHGPHKFAGLDLFGIGERAAHART